MKTLDITTDMAGRFTAVGRTTVSRGKWGSKVPLPLTFLLLFCAAFWLPGVAYAQVWIGNQNLSTGVAVQSDGFDTNGNPVKLWEHTGTGVYTWTPNTPTGEAGNNTVINKHGGKNAITDVIGKGYADMHRTSRNTEEGDFKYVQPGYLGNRYFGVIDFGITRDANWSTVYTVADVSVTGQGAGGTAPGVASHKNWGSEARQQGIADFLKGYNASDGYIDNFVVQGTSTLGKGVFASTAELYGNAAFNAEGGMFDQVRERGYDAGTNYREGGLHHMDRYGAGVIGQSGGYYFDEGGQYAMDVHGNIQQIVKGDDGRPTSSHHPVYGPNGSPVAFDDWNQYGLVMTGADLIAYTTSFNAAMFSEAALIYGNFTVLGDFLDIYINGNLIAHDLLGLNSFLYGTGNILGEYSMMLDLALIDAAFWDPLGLNDISFMVRTVSAWELGLTANTTYAKEAGFNYFSAGIAYGRPNSGAAVPEPATICVLGLGICGLGLACTRKKWQKA